MIRDDHADRHARPLEEVDGSQDRTRMPHPDLVVEQPDPFADPGYEETETQLSWLAAAATTVPELLLIACIEFKLEGWPAIDRALGWTRGQALVVAKRLGKKAGRAA